MRVDSKTLRATKSSATVLNPPGSTSSSTKRSNSSSLLITEVTSLQKPGAVISQRPGGNLGITVQKACVVASDASGNRGLSVEKPCAAAPLRSSNIGSMSQKSCAAEPQRSGYLGHLIQRLGAVELQKTLHFSPSYSTGQPTPSRYPVTALSGARSSVTCNATKCSSAGSTISFTKSGLPERTIHCQTSSQSFQVGIDKSAANEHLAADESLIVHSCTSFQEPAVRKNTLMVHRPKDANLTKYSDCTLSKNCVISENVLKIGINPANREVMDSTSISAEKPLIPTGSNFTKISQAVANSGTPSGFAGPGTSACFIHEEREEGGSQDSLVCPICSKVMCGRNRKQNMEMHMLIHTGARPHKCNHCCYSSTQLSNLRRHMRNVHKLVQCDYDVGGLGSPFWPEVIGHTTEEDVSRAARQLLECVDSDNSELLSSSVEMEALDSGPVSESSSHPL